MPRPVSLAWNLRNYGARESVRWLARAVAYRAWVALTPSGRREANFDRLQGCDTNGHLSREELRLPQDSIHYAPIKPKLFLALMAALGIDPRNFTFIDVGCGKGRALLLARMLCFRRIVGIEYSAELAATALLNCPGCEVFVVDASRFALPPEDSVIYLFNPFWNPAMQRFAENLGRSLASHPRDLRVVYVNPFCEREFAALPALELLSRVPNHYSIFRSRS